MKAYGITARDTQPTQLDLTQPEPAPGEILVTVEAASVNGFDLSVAAGYVWDMLPHEFPVVLGRDLVGTVSAVGDGVDQFRVGDRVAGVIPSMNLGPRTGSFADSVALAATAVTGVPEGIEAVDAAVIGLAGIAAHDALEALNLEPGNTVLISGATGGVGSIATQLATAAGATVIATARPGQEEEYVRKLGALHTVDYTGDLATAVRGLAADGVTTPCTWLAAPRPSVKQCGQGASSPRRLVPRLSRLAAAMSRSPASWRPPLPRSSPPCSTVSRRGSSASTSRPAFRLTTPRRRSACSPTAPSARFSSPADAARCGQALVTPCVEPPPPNRPN